MDGGGTSKGRVAVAVAARQRTPSRTPWNLLLGLRGAPCVHRGWTRGAVRVADAAGRVLRAGVILLGAVGMVALAGALALAWRLGQGPLDLDWIVGRVLAAQGNPEREGGGREEGGREEGGRGNGGQAVAVGHATLAWRGYVEGAGSPAELRVDGARLAEGGREAAAVGPVSVTVSMAGLLHGEVRPETVRAAGLVLHLVRGPDGIRLDGPPRPPPSGQPQARLADVLAGLARPPRGGAGRGMAVLDRLRAVRLDGVDVTVNDEMLGTTERLVLGTVEAKRAAAGGVQGTAGGTLAVGGAQASVSVQAAVAADGGTRVQVAMAPVEADAVGEALHGVTDAGVLDALHAAVGGSATLLLSPSLNPVGAAVHVQAGAGSVRVRDKVIAFDSIAVDGEAGWDGQGWGRPGHASVPHAVAAVRAPSGLVTLTGSGEAEQKGDAVAATVALAVDRVAFTDLPALWPSGVSIHVRPWLTENVTAGVAHDATIRVGLEAPADLSRVHVKSVDGRLVGDDLTVHWLRPVPPIEHAAAVLTITQPDQLDILVPSARQGGLALHNGTVHITGLDVKDQFLGVGLDVSGALPELIGLLNNKRLNLLSKHPLPMRNPAGTMAGHLTVEFPLNHDLRFDQVAIGTHVDFAHVHLGGLVAGRDLDDGRVVLDADVDGLRARGQAKVAGVPGQLAVAMDFKGGPASQVVLSADLTSRATAKQLAGAGLDLGSLMTAGTLGVVAHYEEQRSGLARLHAVGDAKEAGLAVAGWRKAPGPPARVSATVALDHGRLAGIEALQATGPGLVLDGTVRPVDGRPLDLVLSRIVLGATRAAGEVRFPAVEGGPIAVWLQGPMLDLSTQFGTPPAEGPPTELKDNRGTPFVADVRFDQVVLAHRSTVSAVAGHVEDDGRRIVALHVTSGAPEQLVADIRREGTGRRLTLRAADGGAALRALDVTGTIRGGTLVADAVYDDTKASPPLAGQAELRTFHVESEVLVGKVLQALTVYGVPDALSGPGVLFDRLVLPFRWDGAVLRVMSARAFSASLGLTADGWVDSKRHRLDVHGTVVPAYVVNSLLGRIPLVGRLFSPEKGGGLVALDWSVRGPLADPTVLANPLSLLTPGILRQVFSIFD